MDKKAMFQLTYGLFVLTAKEGDFQNGCIINTAIQVTSDPNRISIAVNKGNKTCEMIDKTGEFNVSVLTEKTQFEVFTHFGFQSGRVKDKFEGWGFKETAENGIYYLTGCTNAYISGKVIQKIDLGTHILFIADVTAAEVLSAEPSVTYTYYQQNIKPKPVEQKKKGYTCTVCGYVYEGDELPADFICPICKHGVDAFVKN
ncbi:MAG: flavin reductase [Lachnospiraceae bacterium]|nr:flavin reductase [Lachnospiraceae bacterium]